MGGFWGFNRLGLFKAGVIQRASGNVTATLTPDDVILDGVTFDRRFRPAYEVALTYRPNFTPQELTEFSEDYLTVTESSAGVSSDYPDAERKDITTYIANTVDAQNEAQRLAQFYATPLRLFEVQSFAVPFSFEIGQEVEIFYPYFNMQAGKTGVVLEITDDPLNGLTTLKVLTNG